MERGKTNYVTIKKVMKATCQKSLQGNIQIARVYMIFTQQKK